jgi:hypothetical protein
MIFSPNTIRNSAFAEPFLKQYRKQKLKLLSGTHWLDEVGDYSGTQRPKYVLESDGTAVINSSHITSQTVTSKKGTASATVTTGQIAIGSGWIGEVVLSDGTVYFLEESIGTNFYDSSGAGNDATLTGTGTWAIKRDLTLINNANKYGYTLTGSVIIPVDLSNLALNAEGDALQFVGRVASDMKFVQSNCVELDGIYGGGILDTPVTFTSEFYIEEYLKIDDSVGRYVYADGNGSSRIFTTNDYFRIETNGAGVFPTGNIIELGVTVLYRFRFYMENGNVNIDISKNGVLANTTVTTLTSINMTISVFGLIWGTGTSIKTFKGARCGLNLNGVEFPMAEGVGTTSYAKDDQAKKITWNGGVTWATQDVFHHNINEGFTEGVNMLRYSNDFLNSVWTKDKISSVLNNIIVLDNSDGPHLIYQSFSVELGLSYAMQFKAKKVDTDWATFNFHNFTDVNYRFIYQFSSNTFTYQNSSFTSLTATVQDDGFVLFKATIVATNTNTYANIAIGLSLDGEIVFTGDGTSRMEIKDAQFEKNTIVTPYQETTTQANEGIKLPYKINGAYSNEPTNGHNQSETKFKQVVFREDFGSSSLHFDQSDLSSKVITYADIANTANVFLDTFPNVKIDLETFSPVGIINSQNRKSNGLRTNRDTLFRANE